MTCKHCGQPIYMTAKYWYHAGYGFQRCEMNDRSKNLTSLIDPDLMASPLKEEDVVDKVLNKYLTK
jgi:hypothetical protein